MNQEYKFKDKKIQNRKLLNDQNLRRSLNSMHIVKQAINTQE